MNTLTLAFCPEGSTDVRFLTSIIRRTATDLLQQYGRGEFEVLEPLSFLRPKGELNDAERLLAVARQTQGFHCLVIHADADAATAQAALTERLAPGKALIEADLMARQQLVPLVPVQTTEAWMLADTALLQEALDTELDPVRDLNLPRPARAEEVSRPKELLQQAVQAIQQTQAARHRTLTSELMGDLYSQLADLPLSSLRQLPSFRQFEDDLLAALVHLKFCRPN